MKPFYKTTALRPFVFAGALLYAQGTAIAQSAPADTWVMLNADSTSKTLLRDPKYPCHVTACGYKVFKRTRPIIEQPTGIMKAFKKPILGPLEIHYGWRISFRNPTTERVFVEDATFSLVNLEGYKLTTEKVLFSDRVAGYSIMGVKQYVDLVLEPGETRLLQGEGSYTPEEVTTGGIISTFTMSCKCTAWSEILPSLHKSR